MTYDQGNVTELQKTIDTKKAMLAEASEALNLQINKNGLIEALLNDKIEIINSLEQQQESLKQEALASNKELESLRKLYNRTKDRLDRIQEPDKD
jgi:chromosome segregation ATPase